MSGNSKVIGMPPHHAMTSVMRERGCVCIFCAGLAVGFEVNSSKPEVILRSNVYTALETRLVLRNSGLFARTNDVNANKREASNGIVVRVDIEIK